MKRTVIIEQTLCAPGEQFARTTIESETLNLFDSAKHENDFYVVVAVQYAESVAAYSMFSDSPVEIIGEQLMQREDDGKWVEQYTYRIIGVEPENGLPFVSLKANLIAG